MSTPHAPEAGLTVDGQVVRIIDGDTVEFEVTRRIRVRLLDCWAPETRTTDAFEKQRGLAAKAYLEKLLAGAVGCRLFIPASQDGELSDLFTLGRVLGKIWTSGARLSLSELMVHAGHATPRDPRGRH